MQPRAKSRVFASFDIRFHSAIAVFYFFLPQFCHSALVTHSPRSAAANSPVFNSHSVEGTSSSRFHTPALAHLPAFLYVKQRAVYLKVEFVQLLQNGRATV